MAVLVCNNLLNGADFLLCITKSPSIQNMVKEVSVLSRIPTIQVNYDPWTLERSDIAGSVFA